jgi:hypothetical protein
VSTREQNHQVQLDALAAAHCRKVVAETASTRAAGHCCKAPPDRLHPGDTPRDPQARPDRALGQGAARAAGKPSARPGINLKILFGTAPAFAGPPAAGIAQRMLLMAAEMERDLIRECTLDGLPAAAQGRRGGVSRTHTRVDRVYGRVWVPYTVLTCPYLGRTW